MSSIDCLELRHPDYWTRDFNTWGVNDWDTYWIEKQPQSSSITKHDSHKALADDVNEGGPSVRGLLWASFPLNISKKAYLLNLLGQAGLRIARRGFQVYADTEFDSVEQKRKRIRNKQQTSRNQGEPSSGMKLRKTKNVAYAEYSNSSDSDGYVEYKNASSKRYVRDKPVSHERTPDPTTCSIKCTLLTTPNKPIITKSTYYQYSAHIICALNTTIHLVKETLEEQAYEKVKNMLQMGNKLAIKDSIVEKLEKIFQTKYSEIESKIILETKIEDNQTTEEDRFIFFIRYALLDFVSMFKYLMPKVLDRDMLERSYIVEYLLILRLSDARELLNVEVSGPPYRSTKKHTVGDIKKLLIMAICNLCRLLGNNLDCNIEDAKNVKTYSIQVIGDRLTLFAVSLANKKKYLAVELASCIIPLTFDAISCYKKIFNFFAVIRKEFVEQEKLQKKIRSYIPADNCTENLREWLHLPDDDISL
ncbi:19539_t:CDS:2, partial [Dentiscutata erythropus]